MYCITVAAQRSAVEVGFQRFHESYQKDLVATHALVHMMLSLTLLVALNHKSEEY